MTGMRGRFDPRAARQSRALAPGESGRPRSGLEAAGHGDAGPPVPTRMAAAADVFIDDPGCHVLVVADAEGGRFSPHDRQLLGAARQLADTPAGRAPGAVVLLAPGPDAAFAAEAGVAGADRLAIMFGLAQSWPEQRAEAVVTAIRALQPRHVLFAESLDGGDLARRVAVLMDEPLTGDIEALSSRAAIRAARGGEVEQSCPLTMLLALQPGRALPYNGIPHRLGPQVVIAAGDEASAPRRATPPVVTAGDPATLSLSEAPFVVAGGNGVSDFGLFRALVAALGATPGGSRMVCDAGLMPRHSQIGASGTVLEAECYMALGISGAPQHLQGVGRVSHVIAVNTDLHAAMVERAELAVIADAQAVSVALIAALARRTAAPS